MSHWLGRWAPVGLWLAVIWVGSSVAGLGGGAESLRWRIVTSLGHASEYLVLGLLLARAAGRPQRWWLWPCLWAACIAWGVGDEFHQSFVPGRDVEAYDVVMDAIGSGVGLALAGVWWRARRHA